MKVYVFGNPHLEDDNLAIAVAKELTEHTIIYCTSPDDLLLEEENLLVVLDVVKGIQEPLLITNPKQLKTRSILSLHDFDVGYFVTLLAELGSEKKIKIIGIPQKGDPVRLAQEIQKWL